jgi:surface antigen
VNNEIIRGRHRAPGRHNPLNELKVIARETAQPAMKGAVFVAATGGLVASFANPASAEPLSASSGTAAVGPATGAIPAASTALAKIGYAPAAQKTVTQRATAPKPRVIEDIQVKAQRAAKAAADAKAAAATAERKAAAERASRDLTRRTLTATASTAKSSSNGAVPSASSGMRSAYNWATEGQCTWGALAKWHASEGYYPGGWTGNAMEWASGAANAGYTVTGTPRTRSILVMQPGVHGSSSVGHVAWVTAVNGNEVTII